MLQVASRYGERRQQDRDLLERMVAYAQSGACRWRALLDHFGQALPGPRCETCDNCLNLARHTAAASDAGTAQPDVNAASGEVAQDAVERPGLAAGDRVRTRRHGIGVVRAADALSVTVEFAGGVSRCFQPQFVVPAPARARSVRQAA